jgi:hypothetical protein
MAEFNKKRANGTDSFTLELELAPMHKIGASKIKAALLAAKGGNKVSVQQVVKEIKLAIEKELPKLVVKKVLAAVPMDTYAAQLSIQLSELKEKMAGKVVAVKPKEVKKDVKKEVKKDGKKDGKKDASAPAAPVKKDVKKDDKKVGTKDVKKEAQKKDSKKEVKKDSKKN